MGRKAIKTKPYDPAIALTLAATSVRSTFCRAGSIFYCPNEPLGYTVAHTVTLADGDMNLDQTVAFSERVISQEVSGETVILDLESECYFGLDDVGTRIWQLIRDRGELRAIYDTLLDEYDVEASRLRTDLEALISEACERGLITLGEAP
jgi:hypothetical protein